MKKCKHCGKTIDITTTKYVKGKNTGFCHDCYETLSLEHFYNTMVASCDTINYDNTNYGV